MRHCEAVPAATPLLILVGLLLVPFAATGQPPVAEPGYVQALAAANHLLQAWESGDAENGMALLTNHAKEAANPNVVEKFFSNSGLSAYEISRGKLLKRGRYEFPVVLVGAVSKNVRTRRRFSSIVVVNTGNNDWAVDKLP
jgi:hypothetical protein